MPVVKRGDIRVTSASFPEPCLIFAVTDAKDSTGGPVRTPTVADVRNNVATGGLADWCAVQEYLGMIAENAERMIDETWSTLSFRWYQQRIFLPGWLIKIKSTGAVYEVRGVADLDNLRTKVELTCRQLN